MTINLHLPNTTDTLRPKLTVIGVGGAGGNAVNNMIAANLEGVDFVIANTDAQALETSMTNRTVQLGINATRGLGAGASPEVGRNAAEEAIEEIADFIQGSNMVFITAGMGGGTGTGAAPVIAELAKEQGILTVGVVTKPFHFEGTHRMKIADSGINELQQFVDTLIVIPNQNLFRIANEKTTFADAFRMADEVLHSGVRGVTDLMVKPGLVNLDFADIRAVMSEMGKAMMGTGEASSEKRAIDAAEAAISNPLLDDVSLNGARAVLINITGGPDMTLFEVDEAANRIRDEVDLEANIIFGSTFSDVMEGKMRVSVVATGIEGEALQRPVPVSDAHVNVRALQNGNQATSPVPYKTAARNMEQERSAADIVRQAGKTPVAEVAKQRAHQQELAYARSHGQPAPVAPKPASPVSAAPKAQLLETQGQLDIEEIAAAEQNASEHEDSIKQEEDMFISPRAEHPAKRAPMRAKVAEEELYDDEEAEEAGTSFFQKIAGVGKALAARPEPHQPESRASVSKKDTVSSEDEDYLDIPAFLRRQAN